MEVSITNISKPFNPSQIEVEEKNATINTLLDMLRGDMIDLNPEFQRHADLWNEEKKSRLIESILLGLPIPSFYFEFNKERKKWIVIDGLQRLCALNDFMNGRLKLNGLEFLGDSFSGITYDYMPAYDKVEFGMRTITMNIFKGNTPPNVKFIIFKRLNTGGLELKDAEIRNALFQGRATDLVKDLLDVFHGYLGPKLYTKRMKDHDFVVRFLAHKLIRYSGYKKLSDYLNDVMTLLVSLDDSQADYLKSLFSTTIKYSIDLMGDVAFRKPSKEKKSSISLALFECTMVCLSELTDNDRQQLLLRKPQFLQNYVALFKDEKMNKSLSDGVGQIATVNYRMEATRNMINNTLK